MLRKKVVITPGSLLLVAWLNYMDDSGILPGILLSCGLHELGHLAVLWKLRIPVKRIHITSVGAEICMGASMSYHDELAAALMGPLTNFVLAALFCHIPGGTALAGINLVLGCFNLLPVKSLDGGRVLRCVLALSVGRGPGEEVAKLLSAIAILLLWTLGWWLAFWGGNVTLLLVSFWMVLTVSHCDRKRNK